jgi:hypothetical protein
MHPLSDLVVAHLIGKHNTKRYLETTLFMIIYAYLVSIEGSSAMHCAMQLLSDLYLLFTVSQVIK